MSSQSTAKFFSTVTERGQVSIPAMLRNLCKLGKGARLSWTRLNDRELLVRVEESEPVLGPMAMLGYAQSFTANQQSSTDELLKELRAGEED